VHEFLSFTVYGLFLGAIYAIAASGLVVTYTTSGIFNIAHGAIGMIMAFVFWTLVNPAHVPLWVAFPLVVLVLAPLGGALIERIVIRRVPVSNVTVTLVITVGLTLLLVGAAQKIWPANGRVAVRFFGLSGFHGFGVFVPWEYLMTGIAAVLIAVGLRLFLYRSRTGIAMRGVVDNRELVGLFGGRPSRYATLSWGIGASLASIAGILIAPTLQLDPLLLTLLVIDAYAAAMVGRLRNLPLTFAGGIGVGLLSAYTGYLPTLGSFWSSTPVQGLKNNIPIVILFIVLLALPVSRLRSGSLQRSVSLPTASLFKSVRGGVLLVAAVVVAVSILSVGDVTKLGIGLAFGLVCLSLVPLAGWGGQISICQLTFAGVGAYAMSKWGHGGSLVGYLGAAGLAGAVGAFVSLFALRLRTLYLALATLAFASLMDNTFFNWGVVFTYGGSVPIPRPNLFGYHVNGAKGFDILLAVVFALLSIGLLALRRGPFGRVLIAMKDSESACATLGLSLTMTKLAVFTLSAALAGFAGALFGGAESVAGPDQFVMFKSLLVLAAVSIGGVSLCTSALVGGIALGFLPLTLQGIFLGFGALFLARYSEGILPPFLSWITRPLGGATLTGAGGPASLSGAGGPAPPFLAPSATG
jgi:branched-chain amino acid transport system permease protein